MTTEIAVVNRLGVALATDSAVTISGAGKTKVFDTGDKLFELSDRFPVGVMINGNMDLLGVPWEVIVKDFRATSCDSRGTVKAWLDALMEFCTTHKATSAAAESQQVEAIAIDEFEQIKMGVQRRIIESRTQQPPTEIVNQLVLQVAHERILKYRNAGKPDALSGVKQNDAIRAHRPMLRRLIAASFDPYPIPAKDREVLMTLIAAALLSSALSNLSTGIIVAGYGDGDMFPSIAIGEVDGTVAGRLKFVSGENVIVDRQGSRGRVISFAQTDVVERLLSGADNQFVEMSAEYFGQALESARQAMIGAFASLDGAGEIANDVFGDIIAAVREEYRTKFTKEVGDKFQAEFNEMIAMMPKQDIIELAEALVSITAIERKASSEQATVGGPVDVAFITRHEGFVWIKRKHYFDPALNPRFFWRKFGNTKKPKEGNHEPFAEPA